MEFGSLCGRGRTPGAALRAFARGAPFSPPSLCPQGEGATQGIACFPLPQLFALNVRGQQEVTATPSRYTFSLARRLVSFSFPPGGPASRIARHR